MLLETIKKKSLEATKGRREVERDILRFLLGEVQTIETRQKKVLGDDQIGGIIRKVIENNKEALTHRPQERLEEENQILMELLPATMTHEEIESNLQSELEAIRSCKSDGQAMGVAMKHLKGFDKSTLGDDVKAVIAKIRS